MYKTPGVYVKEVSLFPPSVAEVETAIPAFIGYTERADENGTSLTNVPTRIKSLLEFRELFGGAPTPGTITVTLDNANSPTQVAINPQYFLYNSLRLFYDNGGGDCYIISVGDFSTTVALGDPTDPTNSPGLLVGLDALKKYDEPTIILFPDALSLASPNNLYALQQQALAQCETLQDRVCVFDLFESRAGNVNFDMDDGVTEFRNAIGINSLKYGATYVPHLQTTIPYDFEFNDVALQRADATPVNLATISADPAPVNRLQTAITDRAALAAFIADPLGNGDTLTAGYEAINSAGQTEVEERIDYMDQLAQAIIALQNTTALTDPDLQTALSDLVMEGAAPNFSTLEGMVRTLRQYDQDYFTDTVAAPTPTDLAQVDEADYTAGAPVTYDFTGLAPTAAADGIYNDTNNVGDTDNARAANARDDLRILFEAMAAEVTALHAAAETRVSDLETEVITANAIYANVVQAIQEEGSTLPPSGAIAGVYAYVDRTRGVWKAPANVSLSSVIAPTVMIDDADQESLNVDVNAGKSINAIRTFTGRGTLVWGARTLAGNDNEWRYVPVRRFFNMVEESVKKSTSWAVFEPNDAKLWTKVKGMIDNYLFEKWQEGALQGAKPDEAFFVKVGLGLTMTPQDILNGRLIVQIGMAVVRPAEFIILEFSHKLVETG